MYENAVVPVEEKQEKKRQRLYFCKSKRYANFMIQNGSKIVQISNDKFRPNYLVFVFLWDDVCDANAKRWEEGERETFIG